MLIETLVLDSLYVLKHMLTHIKRQTQQKTIIKIEA
jgi:hypothetical protein